MIWIRWYRTRNGGDGRRASGVGHTITSVYHAAESVDADRAACGIMIGLYPGTNNRQHEGTNVINACSRCQKKVKNEDR